MDKHHGAGAIVVGIDGSKAAVTAAEWALDEAMSRTSPLRLVYVISADDDDYPPETDYAEEALRAARAAVHVGGKAVTVDTAILSGGVDSTLLHESQAAAMICVGTVGIGRIATRFLGSTAVGLVTLFARTAPAQTTSQTGTTPSMQPSTSAAAAAARRKTKPGLELPVTIRRATESDEAALARLAALDSAAVPAAPVLLAESNGELRAALSLRDGETVADPFHPTAKLLELLATFAAQGQDGRRSLMGGRRWRRLGRRRALSGRAVLGHSSWPSRLRRA